MKIKFMLIPIFCSGIAFAKCPDLTKNQINEIINNNGFVIDGDSYGDFTVGYNQGKCLYQVKAHTSKKNGYILTISPITKTIIKSEQKGFHYQYFDDSYVNYL